MKNRMLRGAAVLSLAGMQAPVHAQSSGSVMLYGLVDAGISYVSNEGGHANVKFDDGIRVPNLLGLRGTEDLGGGLHAIFTLVDQFILGNGSIVPGQGLFGHNAYVGIASDRFGTLTFGNQYDFMVDSLVSKGNDPAYNIGLYGFRAGPFNKIAIPSNPPFAGSFDWDHMAGGHPVNNAVKYRSADLAGFSFGALYAFGGVPGSFGSGSSVSAGLNYERGAFGIGAAYTEVKYFTAGQPQVSVSAGYMYMKGNDFLDNNHAHQMGAIVDYILSKRTVAYAETVYQRANSGAQALISGVLDPSGASSGPNQLIARVGLKTSF
jgi:predicted porin